MFKGGAKRENDARRRAQLERLLADFKRVADSQTYALIEDYTNAKKVDCDIYTVYTNSRLLVTILTEMKMGKPVTEVKRILTKEEKKEQGLGRGRFTVFKKGVKAASVTDLDKQTIRNYFGNMARYGKNPDKKRGYQQALREFFNWRASELMDEATELAATDEAEDAKLRKAEAERYTGSLVNAIGKMRKTYRDKSQKRTWEPDHIELALDVVRTRGEVSSRGSKHGIFPYAVRNQAMWALGWEMGLRPFELVELRLGDITESENSPNALQVSVSSERTGRIKNSKVHPRTYDVYESVPYLRQWMQTHPTKDDPDAILLCSFTRGNMVGMLDRDSLRKHINGVAEAIRERMKKRGERFDVDATDSYFTLRHSRITYVLRTRMMSIDEAADYFGTSVQEIMKTYRRVTQKDVSRNYLSNFEDGLVTKPKPKGFAKKFCLHCQEQIPKASEICNLCGHILREPKKAEKPLLIKDAPERISAKQEKLDSLTEAIANTDNAGARKVLLKMYQDIQATLVGDFQTEEEQVDEDRKLAKQLKAEEGLTDADLLTVGHLAPESKKRERKD
ncbi:MAG: site-specific integrase [Thermoplasmata archaeon]